MKGQSGSLLGLFLLLGPLILVVLALCKDQFPQSLLVQVVSLKIEGHGLSHDSLLLNVPNLCEKRVLQAVLKRDPIVRIEDQDFLKEVDCLWR